ncbi:uncharacterized protein CBL_10089 [Carabus blaptoides fortunei]
MTSQNFFDVTTEEEQAIRDSFSRSDEEIAADVAVLKEWLKKQPHLPQDLDEQFIRIVLQRNKFSLEKAKSKLDNYFSIRNLIPEFFENRDMLGDEMQNNMKQVLVVPLPRLTNNLARVILIKFTKPDSELFDFDSYIKFAFALQDLRLYKDPSDSDIFLMDCQNMKLGHVVKFNPVVVKKAMTVFLKAYSERIKGVHFINMQSYVNSLVTLIQSLLKDKLAARVQAHKNLKSLHKVISKDCLPLDYEGDEKSLSKLFVDWKKHIEGKRDWLLKQAELKSNEDLRIEGSIEEDIFGSIHGSFRTLNVD